MKLACRIALLLVSAYSAAGLAQEHTDHAQHQQQQQQHHHHDHGTPTEAKEGPALPLITAADLAAAFPETGHGHATHDRGFYTYLLSELEGGGSTLGWDVHGWIGGDLHRGWLRTDGEREDGDTETAQIEALWGRRFSRWWELVAGVRHDFAPGESQSWAAIGVQGIAPYWFEIEATAYLGEGGQSALRLEAEYDLLITNRLIAQPMLELNFYGRNDRARGIGSGFSSAEAGLRLRYELRRELAPYIGVTWVRAFGNTGELIELAGDDRDDVRAIAGVRFWF